MRHLAKSVFLMGTLGPAALLARPVRQSASSVHVCIGVDRVLRFATGTSCPAGQSSYNLALDGTQPNPPDEDKTAANQISELKKTVEFLRERVSALEKEAAKPEKNESSKPDKKDSKPAKNESSVDHIIRAPFHVVDKSGKAIFTVTDGVATEAIGRVRVGHGSADNYGIWIATSAGMPVVALSEGRDGAGSFSAYDKAGNRSVQAKGGYGFSLFSASDKEIAGIGINAKNLERGLFYASGKLQLVDDAGLTVVEAGADANNVGFVQVYPGATCKPTGLVRVTDCIKGWKR